MTRASEPWEFSDGAVYLVRELCSVDPDKAVLFFEELADIARLTQFVQADCLRETIWKQVKIIMFNIIFITTFSLGKFLAWQQKPAWLKSRGVYLYHGMIKGVRPLSH